MHQSNLNEDLLTPTLKIYHCILKSVNILVGGGVSSKVHSVVNIPSDRDYGYNTKHNLNMVLFNLILFKTGQRVESEGYID